MHALYMHISDFLGIPAKTLKLQLIKSGYSVLSMHLSAGRYSCYTCSILEVACCFRVHAPFQVVKAKVDI